MLSSESVSLLIPISHSLMTWAIIFCRFLQLNLFNETDNLFLYDGSIYNVSSPVLATVSNKWNGKKHFFTTNGTSLSIKMMVSGAAHHYGFIAEIVTLPISAITFSEYHRLRNRYQIDGTQYL